MLQLWCFQIHPSGITHFFKSLILALGSTCLAIVIPSYRTHKIPVGFNFSRFAICVQFDISLCLRHTMLTSHYVRRLINVFDPLIQELRGRTGWGTHPLFRQNIIFSNKFNANKCEEAKYISGFCSIRKENKFIQQINEFVGWEGKRNRNFEWCRASHIIISYNAITIKRKSFLSAPRKFPSITQTFQATRISISASPAPNVLRSTNFRMHVH